MRDAEVTALGRLAGKAFAGPASLARDVHGAVAHRTFGVLGILGMPVRVVHDGISRTAYRTVGGALQAPIRSGAGALARAGVTNQIPLREAPVGRLALAALNGAVGDRLDGDLALELTIRRRGRDVVTDSAGLARAFPDAAPKLAVFVHGLCETEDAWRLVPFTRAGAPHPSYGTRLRDELGYTPLYVRYNTGLHISDNGRRLANVLDHVVSAWPVPVEEIVLVGHSMGGLVSRSACHYGAATEHTWTDRLRHVFCLGTPHLGAPLEKAANVAGWALTRLPEVKPFGAIVNGRSAGIKDLRFGNCVEEDWCDCEPDEFLRDRCREVPFLPNATYYFVGATLVRDPASRLASIVGDLLVQMPSASGQGRRRKIPFEIENGLRLGGLNHFQLLNHPAVYAQMRTWLGRRPQLAEASISSG